MAFLNKRFNEIDNILDIFRRFKPNVGIIYFKLRHHFVDIFNHIFGVDIGRDTRFVGFCDNFIVDVRVVSSVRNVKADFL